MVGRRGRPEDQKRQGRRCDVPFADNLHVNADDCTLMTHGALVDRCSGCPGTVTLCVNIDHQPHVNCADVVLRDDESGGAGMDARWMREDGDGDGRCGVRDDNGDAQVTQGTLHFENDRLTSDMLLTHGTRSQGTRDDVACDIAGRMPPRHVEPSTADDGDGMAWGRPSGLHSLTSPHHQPSTSASQAFLAVHSRGGKVTRVWNTLGPGGDDCGQRDVGWVMRAAGCDELMRHRTSGWRGMTEAGRGAIGDCHGTLDLTTTDDRHRLSPRRAEPAPRAADAAANDRHRPRGAPKPLTRIGEATNPGPGSEYITVGPVSYPAPNKPGFHAELMHQRDEGDNGGGRTAGFGMKIDSTNTTSWGALKRFLKRTTADLVLAQEHHLGPDEVPARSAWALRSGWHSIFAPAQKGDGAGWKAGVAIFARPAMGLAMPRVGGHIVAPHRAVGATVSPPGYRQFTAVSVYLEDGKGVSQSNLDILADVGAFLTKQGDDVPFVVGGDFQMRPCDLAAVGFASKVGGEIVASGDARGTCRSSRTSAEIDFFILHKHMVLGVKDISTVEDAGTRPHVPVRVEFRPRLVAAKALIARPPPRIGTELVYGPLPAPPCWDKVKSAVDELLTKVRAKGFCIDDNFRGAYENCYAAWADNAELEVAAANADMVEVPKLGLRGRRPAMKWRSVLPERPPKPQEGEEEVTSWRNVANVLTDLKRVAHLVTPLHANDADETEDGFIQDLDDGDVPQALDDIVDQLNGFQIWDGAGLAKDMIVEEREGRTVSYNDVIIRLRAIALAMRSASRSTSGRGLNALYDHLQATTAGRAAVILGELDAEITSAVNTVAAKLRNQEAQGWRDWISKNLAAGARNAHRFLRLPTEWRPSTVITEDGVVTADPNELVKGYADKYHSLWNGATGKGDERTDDVPWRGCNWEPLPRPTPDDIRNAAKTFATDTATAYDGFSMRHYSWMSDGALHIIADFVELMERTGEMPPQLCALAMPLLPKPRGGHRAIATFTSLYRLWGRLRRDVVRRWEDTIDRPYFAAGSGRAPQDAVWRQAARAEAAVTDGSGCSAALLWDLAAYFETVKRRPLWHRARRLGFPMAVAAVAFNSYDSVRMLSLAGAVSTPMYARDGIPAGCGLAMAFTKAYSVEAFDRVVDLIAAETTVPTHLTVYVDDIALAAEGTASQVIASLTIAEDALRSEIEGPLACTIEKGKAAVVASSRRIVNTLAARFGDYAGPAAARGVQAGRSDYAVPNLGVDFAPGCRRATHGPRSKRRMRMARLRQKAKRVAKLRAVAGARTPSIFTSGPLPEAVYGAAVNGLTDMEVVALRRAAAHAYTPRAKGRSLRRLMALVGLPTWKAEVEVILQFAKEVWHASLLGPAIPSNGQMTLPQVSQIWHAVDTTAVFHADGERRRWCNARGPITSMHLTLHRIGWKATSPFVLRDDFGDDVVLTKTSPQLLAQMLKAAALRSLQREVGTSIARSQVSFSGKRVATEHIAAQLKSDRKLNALDRASVMAVICNAVMTHDKAAKMGYMVTNLCPLCRQHTDTIFNRIWKCQHRDAVAARDLSAPAWLQREVERTEGAADDIFWTTGFFAHPGDEWPRPRSTAEAEYEWRGDEPRQPADRHDDGRPAVSGSTYIDGSCTTGVFPELRRAAASLVQWSREKPSGWTIRTPVPAPLPQTPQSAEHVALAVTRQFADTRLSINVASDCSNVVKDAGPITKAATSARKTYAAMNKENLADHAWRAAATVRKVPAHVNPAAAPEGQARDDAEGNQMADEAAKEAVLLHPQPLPTQVTALDAAMKRARLVIRTVARVTQAFPPMPRERMIKIPRTKMDAISADEERHAWTFGAGLWRCTKCLRLTIGDTVSEHLHTERCTGAKATMDVRAIERRGHILAKSMGEVPVIVCVKCGSFAARRAYGLANPCPVKPTPAGRQALARIKMGRQPWCDRKSREYRPTLSSAPMAWDPNVGEFVTTAARHRTTRRRTREDRPGHGNGNRFDQDEPNRKLPRTCSATQGDVDHHAHHHTVQGAERPLVIDEVCMHDVLDADDLVHVQGEGTDAISRTAGTTTLRDAACIANDTAALSHDGSGACRKKIRGDCSEVRQFGHREPNGTLELTTADVGSTDHDQGGAVDLMMQENGAQSKRRRIGTEVAGCTIGDYGACEAAEITSASNNSQDQHRGVLAISTYPSVAVAREGPRGLEDPAFRSEAVAAACPPWDTAAATVAKDVVAAPPQARSNARCPQGRRGKAARGPASGVAAPLEDSGDAAGERMGRDTSTSSQAKSHAAGGGRPRTRRCERTSSHTTPKRLGARPSTLGHELSDENGLPPTLEKREEAGRQQQPPGPGVGSVELRHRSRAGPWERPQRGRPCRVPSARGHECMNRVDVNDPADESAQQGQHMIRRATARGPRKLATATEWSAASSSSAPPPSLGGPPVHGDPAIQHTQRAIWRDISNTRDTVSGDDGQPAGHGTVGMEYERHRTAKPKGAAPNAAQREADVDRGHVLEDASGRPAFDGNECLARTPPPPACSKEQAGYGDARARDGDGNGGDDGRKLRGQGMQLSSPRDGGERPRATQGMRALHCVRDRGHGDHLALRGPHEGHGGYVHGLEHRDDHPGRAELASERRHNLDGSHLDDGTRGQPQRQCGDRAPSSGGDAKDRSVEPRDSVSINYFRSTPGISGSWEGPGRVPNQRAATSSSPATSPRGASGARPTTSACPSPASHGAAAIASHADAAGEDPLANQLAQPPAQAGPPVPIWMRTPSWLYLPHLEPPAMVMHMHDVGGRQDEVGAGRDMHAAPIRGRDISPGTRRLTPMERAREKLASRNAHLARSFRDHAERVEKRKARERSPEVTITPADRIAAIRRRLAARQAAMGTVTASQDPVAAAGESGEPRVEGITSSIAAGGREPSGEQGTRVERPRVWPQDATQDREPRGRRCTRSTDRQPPVEEEDTPETGKGAATLPAVGSTSTGSSSWGNEPLQQIHLMHGSSRIQDAPACAVGGAPFSRVKRLATSAVRERDLGAAAGWPGASSDAANEASRVAWHDVGLMMPRPR